MNYKIRIHLYVHITFLYSLFSLPKSSSQHVHYWKAYLTHRKSLLNMLKLNKLKEIFLPHSKCFQGLDYLQLASQI